MKSTIRHEPGLNHGTGEIFFTCPGCEQAGEESIHHVKHSRVVEGVHYCTLCGDMLVDEMIMKVLVRACDGPIKFTVEGKHHELAASFMDPFGFIQYKLSITCFCPGGCGKIEVYHPDFTAFWNQFTAFIEDQRHYSAIKVVVENAKHDK